MSKKNSGEFDLEDLDLGLSSSSVQVTRKKIDANAPFRFNTGFFGQALHRTRGLVKVVGEASNHRVILDDNTAVNKDDLIYNPKPIDVARWRKGLDLSWGRNNELRW